VRGCGQIATSNIDEEQSDSLGDDRKQNDLMLERWRNAAKTICDVLETPDLSKRLAYDHLP
jgi:hypothetical protein